MNESKSCNPTHNEYGHLLWSCKKMRCLLQSGYGEFYMIAKASKTLGKHVKVNYTVNTFKMQTSVFSHLTSCGCSWMELPNREH